MTLVGVSESVVVVHTWFYLHLFIWDSLNQSLPIKGNRLLFIRNGLYASVVKFLQSYWEVNFYSWHWWHFRLINTSKCRAKERSFNFSSILVTDIVKGVIFQKVSIENLVAVLLVNISTVEQSIICLYALSEHLSAIFIKDSFPLSYNLKFRILKICNLRFERTS